MLGGLEVRYLQLPNYVFILHQHKSANDTGVVLLGINDFAAPVRALTIILQPDGLPLYPKNIHSILKYEAYEPICLWLLPL